MYVDAFCVVRSPDTAETVECRSCGGRASRVSSRSNGSDRHYHHYRCQRSDCDGGGTLVQDVDDSSIVRRVGPVFGDVRITARLTARKQRASSNTTGDTTEARS